MHRVDRLIMLAAFLALAIYRLIRYTKAATTRGPRPAIPSTSGALARTPAPEAMASSTAPVDPAGSGGSALAAVAGFLVFALGNAAVWLCLFELPALEDVPVIWRLVAGVLASFYLIVLARRVAARLRGRPGPGSQMPGGNPFPDS
jgi:hypothetical protein